MVLFKKFFCCKVVKTGCYVVGIFQMLYYLVVMTASMIITNTLSQSKVSHANLFASTMVMLIFTAGITVAGVILIIGLYMNKKYYIIPFLISSFSCLVSDLSVWLFVAVEKLSNGTGSLYLFTMTDIFLNFFGRHESAPFTILLVDLLVVAVNTYTFLYIFAYYQTLEEASIMRRTERTVAVHRDDISGASLNSVQFSPEFSINSNSPSDGQPGLQPPSYPPPSLLDTPLLPSHSQAISTVGQENYSVRLHIGLLDILNIDGSLIGSIDNQSVERDSLPFEGTERVISEHDSSFLPETGIGNENAISYSTGKIASIEGDSQTTPELSTSLIHLSIGELSGRNATNTTEVTNLSFDPVLNLDQKSMPQNCLKMKNNTKVLPISQRSFTFVDEQNSKITPEIKVSSTDSYPPPLPPRHGSGTLGSVAPPRLPPRVINQSSVTRKYLMKQKNTLSNRVHSLDEETSSCRQNPEYPGSTGLHLMERYEKDTFDTLEEVHGGSIHSSVGHSLTEDAGQASWISNVDSDQRVHDVIQRHNFFRPNSTQKRDRVRRSEAILNLAEVANMPISPPHRVLWSSMDSLAEVAKTHASHRLCQEKLSSTASPPHRVLWPPMDSLTMVTKMPACPRLCQGHLASPANRHNRVLWPPLNSLADNDEYVTLAPPTNAVNRQERSYPLLNIGDVGGARPKLPTVEKGRRRKTKGLRIRKNKLKDMFKTNPRKASLSMNQNKGNEFMWAKSQVGGCQTICDNLGFEDDNHPLIIEGATGGQPLTDTSRKTHVLSSGYTHEPEDESIFYVCFLPEKVSNTRRMQPIKTHNPWKSEKYVKAMTEDPSRYTERDRKKDKKKYKKPPQR